MFVSLLRCSGSAHHAIPRPSETGRDSNVVACVLGKIPLTIFSPDHHDLCPACKWCVCWFRIGHIVMLWFHLCCTARGCNQCGIYWPKSKALPILVSFVTKRFCGIYEGNGWRAFHLLVVCICVMFKNVLYTTKPVDKGHVSPLTMVKAVLYYVLRSEMIFVGIHLS